MVMVWLLMAGAVIAGAVGAWLLVGLLPDHPPDPRDDEPHTYELAYDAATDTVTCETWCPKCHAWTRPRLCGAYWYSACKHWPHDTTKRGQREIKRFHRESKHGDDPDTFVIDFFNAIDRICYGKPVRGETHKR